MAREEYCLCTACVALISTYHVCLYWICGFPSEKPHETLLVLYGRPKGLKGLSYMLSATVIPTKVSLRLYCIP